jgi:hypothetical protein
MGADRRGAAIGSALPTRAEAPILWRYGGFEQSYGPYPGYGRAMLLMIARADGRDTTVAIIAALLHLARTVLPTVPAAPDRTADGATYRSPDVTTCRGLLTSEPATGPPTGWSASRPMVRT